MAKASKNPVPVWQLTAEFLDNRNENEDTLSLEDIEISINCELTRDGEEVDFATWRGSSCSNEELINFVGNDVRQVYWREDVSAPWNSGPVLGLDEAIQQYRDAENEMGVEAVVIPDAVVCRAIVDVMRHEKEPFYPSLTDLIANIMSLPQRVVCRSMRFSKTGMAVLASDCYGDAEETLRAAAADGDLNVIDTMIANIPLTPLILVAAEARFNGSDTALRYLVDRFGYDMVIDYFEVPEEHRNARALEAIRGDLVMLRARTRAGTQGDSIVASKGGKGRREAL